MSAEEGRSTLRVMTYNIKGGEGGYGQWKKFTPNGQRDFLDLDHIAALIESEQPDILSLQEIAVIGKHQPVADQVRYLASSLRMHAAFAPIRNHHHFAPGGRLEGDYWGNAVLSRFPIEDWQVYEFAAGRPVDERCALLARIHTAAGPLSFVAVHLSYSRPAVGGQVQELAEIVGRQVAEGPVILAGDFNVGASDPDLAPCHTILTDVFSACHVPLACPSRKSFPNGCQSERDLDHIFVSSHVMVHRAWVRHDDSGVSDHNPVVADISLRGSR